MEIGQPTHVFQEGDIIYSQGEGKYYPAKILKIDTLPDGTTAWHKALYKAQDSIPTVDDILKTEVSVMHVPMIAHPEDAHFLLNVPLSEDDLIGYKYYLEDQQ